MNELHRRNGDGLLGKILRFWPIVVAIAILVASYAKNDALLNSTVGTVKDTVERVNAIERKIDVQGQMLSDIRDAVKEIARRRRD